MADSLTVQYRPAGGSWLLHPPSDPWGDGYIVVMPVEPHDAGLSGRQTVELDRPTEGELPDLVSYFEDLADRWHGWSRARHLSSTHCAGPCRARDQGLGFVDSRVVATVCAGA